MSHQTIHLTEATGSLRRELEATEAALGQTQTELARERAVSEAASRLVMGAMMAAQSDRARRLQTMPGVGPLTAVAVEAFGPDMADFKTGRNFAAWLGLVPRQHSSGGNRRLRPVGSAAPYSIGIIAEGGISGLF